MFNKKKEDKMSNEKPKVWLVIEKYVYSNSSATHMVKKTAYSIQEAIEFKIALEKLNEQKEVVYYLASDVDTVLESACKHHNESIENGTYYDNHPEIKKPEKKEVEEEILF